MKHPNLVSIKPAAAQTKKLSADVIKTLTKPGRYSDGGGLYFVIGKSHERRWAFLYRAAGNVTLTGNQSQSSWG